jgi:hypothetical protein
MGKLLMFMLMFEWCKELIFMDHATKECEVANFHGQTSDVYAYV